MDPDHVGRQKGNREKVEERRLTGKGGEMGGGSVGQESRGTAIVLWTVTHADVQGGRAGVAREQGQNRGQGRSKEREREERKKG